jgi:hypothetical protein
LDKKDWKVCYALEAALGDGCSNFRTKTAGDRSLMANLLRYFERTVQFIKCMVSKKNKLRCRGWNFVPLSKRKQINSSKKLLTRSFPVFLTDASTVSLSHGISVLRSMSSQDIPSCQIVGLEMINHENEEDAKWGKGITCNRSDSDCRN